MKKKWCGIRVVMGLCAAFCWWGFLFPELALTPDTVKVSVEDENGASCDISSEWSFDSNLYFDLLNADEDQITVRSRLLSEIGLFWEALHDDNKTKSK